MMENALRCVSQCKTCLPEGLTNICQVHKLEDGTVAVFSRNSEDMSKKYPDLVEQLPRVRSIIYEQFRARLINI